jgi:hypothetical protein
MASDKLAASLTRAAAAIDSSRPSTVPGPRGQSTKRLGGLLSMPHPVNRASSVGCVPARVGQPCGPRPVNGWCNRRPQEHAMEPTSIQPEIVDTAIVRNWTFSFQMTKRSTVTIKLRYITPLLAAAGAVAAPHPWQWPIRVPLHNPARTSTVTSIPNARRRVTPRSTTRCPSFHTRRSTPSSLTAATAIGAADTGSPDGNSAMSRSKAGARRGRRLG